MNMNVVALFPGWYVVVVGAKGTSTCSVGKKSCERYHFWMVSEVNLENANPFKFGFVLTTVKESSYIVDCSHIVSLAES